jgi:single-strand DNA-binding protein
MSDLNSVVLVGRLVRDPELHYTPQGAAVCEFTVAVNRQYTKKDGEKVDEVSYVDVTSWNRMAEVATEYLKKGRQVALAGSLVQDRWEDKESGKTRSKIRVQAQSVQFLGGAKENEGAPEAEIPAEEPLVDSDPDAAPARPAAAAPAPSTAGARGRAPAARR